MEFLKIKRKLPRFLGTLFRLLCKMSEATKDGLLRCGVLLAHQAYILESGSHIVIANPLLYKSRVKVANGGCLYEGLTIIFPQFTL